MAEISSMDRIPAHDVLAYLAWPAPQNRLSADQKACFIVSMPAPVRTIFVDVSRFERRLGLCEGELVAFLPGVQDGRSNKYPLNAQSLRRGRQPDSGKLATRRRQCCGCPQTMR